MKMLLRLNRFILFQWSLSIPPENSRKLEVFECFYGAQNKASDLKWVKYHR